MNERKPSPDIFDANKYISTTMIEVIQKIMTYCYSNFGVPQKVAIENNMEPDDSLEWVADKITEVARRYSHTMAKEMQHFIDDDYC